MVAHALAILIPSDYAKPAQNPQLLRDVRLPLPAQVRHCRHIADLFSRQRNQETQATRVS